MPGAHAPRPSATRVEIFGQTLAIKGAADDGYTRGLAAYVTAHMARLAHASPLTPLPHVAMLAAMNIAHELFALRSRTDARDADLEHRTRELLDHIEAQFQTAPPAGDAR